MAYDNLQYVYSNLFNATDIAKVYLVRVTGINWTVPDNDDNIFVSGFEPEIITPDPGGFNGTVIACTSDIQLLNEDANITNIRLLHFTLDESSDLCTVTTDADKSWNCILLFDKINSGLAAIYSISSFDNVKDLWIRLRIDFIETSSELTTRVSRNSIMASHTISAEQTDITGNELIKVSNFEISIEVLNSSIESSLLRFDKAHYDLYFNNKGYLNILTKDTFNTMYPLESERSDDILYTDDTVTVENNNPKIQFRSLSADRQFIEYNIPNNYSGDIKGETITYVAPNNIVMYVPYNDEFHNINSLVTEVVWKSSYKYANFYFNNDEMGIYVPIVNSGRLVGLNILSQGARLSQCSARILIFDEGTSYDIDTTILSDLTLLYKSILLRLSSSKGLLINYCDVLDEDINTIEFNSFGTKYKYIIYKVTQDEISTKDNIIINSYTSVTGLYGVVDDNHDITWESISPNYYDEDTLLYPYSEDFISIGLNRTLTSDRDKTTYKYISDTDYIDAKVPDRFIISNVHVNHMIHQLDGYYRLFENTYKYIINNIVPNRSGELKYLYADTHIGLVSTDTDGNTLVELFKLFPQQNNISYIRLYVQSGNIINLNSNILKVGDNYFRLDCGLVIDSNNKVNENCDISNKFTKFNVSSDGNVSYSVTSRGVSFYCNGLSVVKVI